jgi:hypothetical protein
MMPIKYTKFYVQKAYRFPVVWVKFFSVMRITLQIDGADNAFGNRRLSEKILSFQICPNNPNICKKDFYSK